MGSANDVKVLALKDQIQKKKDKIEKLHFTPITNCSIEHEGSRHNIQVLNKEQLLMLLIKLNAYRLSMVDLGIDKYPISGYDIRDWMTDIKLKIEVLSRKDEENSLKALEKKLDQLLSEDKKTELELSSIESLLKG